MQKEDERIEELLKSPKFAEYKDTEEVPDELLDELSSEELTLIYVEQMLEDVGVEADNDTRVRLYNELNDFVMAKIAEQLPEDVLKKIEAGEDEDGIIEKSGVDVSKITEEAMVEFREKFLKQQGGEA